MNDEQFFDLDPEKHILIAGENGIDYEHEHA